MRRQKSWIAILTFVMAAIGPFSVAQANDTPEFAAVLFFDRCFPKHNVCSRFFDQFPNISVALKLKTEDQNYRTYSGQSVRTQTAFGHTYTQTVSLSKVESKIDKKMNFSVAVSVVDESRNEVIHPFSVSPRNGFEDIDTLLIDGAILDQPEWESFVRPKFYLGRKFIQESRQVF